MKQSTANTCLHRGKKQKQKQKLYNKKKTQTKKQKQKTKKKTIPFAKLTNRSIPLRPGGV